MQVRTVSPEGRLGDPVDNCGGPGTCTWMWGEGRVAIIGREGRFHTQREFSAVY